MSAIGKRRRSQHDARVEWHQAQRMRSRCLSNVQARDVDLVVLDQVTSCSLTAFTSGQPQRDRAKAPQQADPVGCDDGIRVAAHGVPQPHLGS